MPSPTLALGRRLGSLRQASVYEIHAERQQIERERECFVDRRDGITALDFSACGAALRARFGVRGIGSARIINFRRAHRDSFSKIL